MLLFKGLELKQKQATPDKYKYYIGPMKHTPESISSKPKYENSSRKIKQLYQEFENLKQRISTPKKPKKQPMLSLYDNPRSNYGIQMKAASLSLQTNWKKQDYDLGAKSVIDHETRVFLKLSLQKFINGNVSNLERELHEKTQVLQRRLARFSKIMQQVKGLMKLSKENSNSIRNLKCNCKQKEAYVKEMKINYEKKIQEMQASYNSKIGLFLKEEQTSGSSSGKRFSKQARERLKILEQKVLLKQEEIIEQQKQIMRLRKINDQKQSILYEKENMLSDLMKQTQEKNIQIMSHKNMIERLKRRVEEKNIELDKKNDYQQKIRVEIENLQQKNEALLSEIKCLKISIVPGVHESSSLKNSSMQKEWEFSEIHNQGEEQMIDYSLKIDSPDHLSPMRHSYFIQNKTKKIIYGLETKVKELESQLQLVVEENKVLKSKKDHFQQQIKQNEVDEEKFQMQSQILRDEIKRMSISLKNLDECATQAVEGVKLGLDKLQNLQQGLKFKEAYLKKNPIRSMSVKKK